jgi:hypothetical protein
MKRLILILLILAGTAFGATCSTDPNNPNVLPGFTVEAGKILYWRIVAVDPCFDPNSSFVDVVNVTGKNEPWVSFGNRVFPDNNQYSWLPKVSCSGKSIDYNSAFVASRDVQINPPVTVSGNFNLNYLCRSNDANLTTYWRTPFTVTPPKELISSGGGPRGTASYLPADLTHDYVVDISDLKIFADNWLTPNKLNLTNGNNVNFADFAEFAKSWMGYGIR